ncbi:MAG: hypothetical protein ACXAEU_25900 [Candidatus Hodarchaeales archaeon]|jgi:hypothetical protein
MGAKPAIRGYLLQTILCILDALENDNEWYELALEPENQSEKVDIIWYYSNPERNKVVQVKSSQNKINMTQRL